jgi:hypothetical protein
MIELLIQRHLPKCTKNYSIFLLFKLHNNR